MLLSVEINGIVYSLLNLVQLLSTFETMLSLPYSAASLRMVVIFQSNTTAGFSSRFLKIISSISIDSSSLTRLFSSTAS